MSSRSVATTAATVPELNLYIISFNCGSTLISIDAFASTLFSQIKDGDEFPECLVLCLQEIAPIAPSFLGGSFVTPYFDRFRAAVREAASARGTGTFPKLSYTNVYARNVGTTAIMLFVRQDRKSRIVGLQTAGLGCGLMERIANKGAVGVKISYLVDKRTNEKMDVAFVSAHLTSGEGITSRRNRIANWKTICENLIFTQVGVSALRSPADQNDEDEEPLLQRVQDGDERDLYPGWDADSDELDYTYGIFDPTCHLFLGGDLNFRAVGGTWAANKFMAYPQPVGDPSHMKHFSAHFCYDELTNLMRDGEAFEGLKESQVDFPPTYKYDPKKMKKPVLEDKEMEEWPWSTRRWPSWCDRILWLDLPPWIGRTRNSKGKIKVHSYRSLPLLKTSDHRPVVLSISVPLKAIQAPESNILRQSTTAANDPRIKPPFSLNPTWNVRRANARRWEMVIGFIFYLFTTTEGMILLLFVFVGIVAGIFSIQYLLSWDTHSKDF